MKAIIVAMDLLGQIGDADTNQMLWGLKDLPADTARFKALTRGKTVIIGRKTWESIGSKPLPNRRNFVVTSKEKPSIIPFVTKMGFANNVLDVLADSYGMGDVFFIGGASVYREVLEKDLADTMFITKVLHEFEIANPVKFPLDLTSNGSGVWFDPEKWSLVSVMRESDGKYQTEFYHYVRKR